jgi:uncharacterized protein
MHAADTTIVDLGRLALSHGEACRIDVPVRPGELEIGGQRYTSRPPSVDSRVDVSRTSGGYALRLRFGLGLEGPCVRCLKPASIEIEVDAREVDQPPADDEELRSPYVEGAELDLGSWAHDAIALALPPKLLCRPDCAGLCPVCGQSLNDADPDEHRHGGSGDPRFAKLRELRLE